MSSPSHAHDSPEPTTESILNIGFSSEAYPYWGLNDFQPQEEQRSDIQTQNTVQDSEFQPPPKKQKKGVKNVVKPKSKGKPRGGRKTGNKSNIDAESSDEDIGTKRGPNWKEHWIVNLIHLRGKMHAQFSTMRKQGVDNWSVLHTHLVAACPDFDRSSDACRKKWKKIYDEYKSDYVANGISGNGRASKSKYYDLIDGYMHERANVLKHVHASAHDENPNPEEDIPQDDVPESSSVPEPSSSTPSIQGKKKTEKLATQDAIAVMAEQSKELTKVVRESEAAKLALLQGMLATMGDLVKKL